MGYLETFFAILAVSIFFTLFLRKCKIEATLGYIITGFVLGPSCIGFLQNPSEIQFLGELGIILLLFSIGVELSFNRLKNLRSFVFGLGGSQFVFTGSVLSFLFYYFVKLNIADAVMLGYGLALSSTALIMQILSQQSELSSKFGRASFCILLFQDLAVVPIIILSKIMYSNTPLIEMLSGVSNNICVALFICAVLGKFILKPLFKIAADEKTYDVFMMMTLATIVGISIITLKAGLSVEFGAFLAGLMLSETSYRHRVEADIQPFRGILLGMFFIAIGMEIDPKVIVQFPVLILSATLSLMFIKALITYLVAFIYGLPKIISMRIALIISGCGEFAFVLFGSTKLSIDPELKNIIFAAVSFSMLVTPFLDMLGKYIFTKMSFVDGSKQMISKEIEDKVVIIGYNDVADMLIKLLVSNKIAYVVIDSKIDRVEELQYKGVNVVYGNPTKEMLFDILGLSNARAFVVNTKNVKESIKVVSDISKAEVAGKVLIRVINEDQRSSLEEVNVYSNMSESRYSAMLIGKNILREFGYSNDEAEDAVDKFLFF